MPSLNKVLLMGNLTRDPELRVTPKGTPICQFSLAINRQFKMESGESREEVIYVDIEAWGKQGAMPMGMSIPEFDKFLRAEIVKWAPVVRATGMKVD